MAKDIRDLRNFTSAPNSSLQQIIELNKTLFPYVFKKQIIDMDSLEFVKVVREIVLNSTVSGIHKTLLHPPGRSPAKDLIAISNWFLNLSEEDKEMMLRVIKMASRDTAFSFLCMLDGVIAIEGPDKGDLKLYYEKRGKKVLINDQSKINLHELI